jgi:hypothetical protein
LWCKKAFDILQLDARPVLGVECGQGRERKSLMRFAALGNPAGEIAPVESVELGAEARGGVSGERRGGEPPAT